MNLRTNRPYLPLGATAILIAALVAALAVGDHHRNGRRSHRADVDAWFCEHRLTRCDAVKPETLELRWEVRERGYEALFGVAVLAAGFAAVSALRGRTA